MAIEKRCTEWCGEHAAVVAHNINYIDRLAMYEDTGLMPDEVSGLRALHDAKRELCDFCRRYDFGNVKAGSDKYEAYLHFSGGSRRFPMEEQFNYCPVCGRSLKSTTNPE